MYERLDEKKTKSKTLAAIIINIYGYSYSTKTSHIQLLQGK